MSCYIINLKQLRNCGLSLNDKMIFRLEFKCVMGGPLDITKVFRSNNIGMFMWNMLNTVCHNYSDGNALETMIYLSDSQLFDDIKTPLLTKNYYEEIKDKITKLENEELKRDKRNDEDSEDEE